MSVHTIESNIQSLVGKYFEVAWCYTAYRPPFGVVSPSFTNYSGSYEDDIEGYCGNNMVHYTSDINAQINLFEFIKFINSITNDTVPNDKIPITDDNVPVVMLVLYKITGIKKLTFYNYNEEIPKDGPKCIEYYEYPKNKELMTPYSMLFEIKFDAVEYKYNFFI
jgi:hypothetical protein